MKDRLEIKNAHRIVVKVGTSTLTHSTGRLNIHQIELLVRQLSDLVNQGKEILLVTSGAVGAGLDRMKLKEKPEAIPEKQALAAIGQGILMHIYEKLFSEYGQTVAQVLLTKENSLHYSQYINSRNALLALLQMNVIPIINENDVVTVEQLKFGDNDTLSAMVASIVDADALILLTDIDGLYNKNPQTCPDAKLLERVTEITPEIEAIAGGAGTKMGTGGMFTKIQAAKIAMSSGVNMVIANGSSNNILNDILAGENYGTIFPAREAHLKQRKSWLAFGKSICGSITVDKGCEDALVKNGSSILAAGITDYAGEFAAGNTVRVLTADDREIARGIINYDTASLTKILGHNTRDFTSLLSGKIYNEVIHRDNMVLMV
ncbi:glutamate 5-kinase [Pectinatus brassicae]|uniref:Glutamate 5-kinase n=1 Tax=Pectinatus brassicae TaxID=862415 RepID=A0A840UWI5_9FIRM|nr:glutamate 5-kinase [Pectinatus brassicae]MBB5337243.1 glutamate 5-kinase [Pectinatus brassicae]